MVCFCLHLFAIRQFKLKLPPANEMPLCLQMGQRPLSIRPVLLNL
jgi:hypothetical protein